MAYKVRLVGPAWVTRRAHELGVEAGRDVTISSVVNGLIAEKFGR